MHITVTPTTELEAVNALLDGIGESPVITLEDLEFEDASRALAYLRDASKATQLEGWSWNTEFAYSLYPDTAGNVYVPENALKTIFVNNPRYTVRGRKVYDPEGHTDVFADAISVNLIVGLPFEDLPEAARRCGTAVSKQHFEGNTENDELANKAATKAALEEGIVPG